MLVFYVATKLDTAKDGGNLHTSFRIGAPQLYESCETTVGKREFMFRR